MWYTKNTPNGFSIAAKLQPAWLDGSDGVPYKQAECMRASGETDYLYSISYTATSDLFSQALLPPSFYPAQKGNHSAYITSLFKVEMKSYKSTT